MNLELTGQGLILMVVGLAVVFTFLVTLILVMTATSRLFVRYAHLMPDDVTEPPRDSSSRRDADEGSVVAAIVATLSARQK